MGYAEGNTHGFTQFDAKMEEREFLFDTLSTNVEEILNRENANGGFRKAWAKLKAHLIPHWEQVPFNWDTDAYGNEVCDYESEIVSCYETYEDELADICWLAGFCLETYHDYWDGSPRYVITLPDSFEQAEKNMKEASEYWNEIYGE